MNRIRGLLAQIFQGEPWVGNNLSTTLDQVSASDAATHWLTEAHSIWEIVLHLKAWRSFLLHKLKGDQHFNIEQGEPEDWPTPPEATEEAWQQTLQDLTQNQAEISDLLENWQDEQLESTVPGRPYSFYTLIHGIIQHDYYHIGQISLIKKQIAKAD